MKIMLAVLLFIVPMVYSQGTLIAYSPGRELADNTNGLNALGAPDGVTASLSPEGFLSVGMEIQNRPGFDFYVYGTGLNRALFFVLEGTKAQFQRTIIFARGVPDAPGRVAFDLDWSMFEDGTPAGVRSVFALTLAMPTAQMNIDSITAVPEPSAWAIGLIGLVLIFLLRRKQKRE